MSHVRVMQIIVGGLATGVTVFALVVLLLRSEEAGEGMNLSLIMLALGLVSAVMAIVIPQTMTATGGAAGVGVFQTRLIVRCALLEGAAFLNLVAYWIEGQLFSLGFGLLMLAAILMQMPTVGRVAEWLARQERRAEEHRAFER